MSGRFEPGDHLQVRRPFLYNHHGIYVSDDRVIQFGTGISDKPKARIEAVSLTDFEKGGTAEVVRHGRSSPFTGYHPPPDAPWKIIERAEFLLKLQPKLRYNLIGHNCEHIANMCACGGWTESYQTRTFFGVRTLMDMALFLWVTRRVRAKLPIPRWVLPVVVGGLFVSIGVKETYDHQIKLFWSEIRDDWFAHELMLAEDPRNELPN
jgi:hypothetical protein